ncbi:MAG TPA: type II toxin-antitoxin system VapC family toxin [Gammaproteobacteria bacterium]|nr:type II toxin-antitoxin system VapC family toxin [Gammaproteobacteria bacterium]
MGLIVDTSVLILAEKNKINFSQWEKYGDVYISSITISELLVGVHRANSEDRRIKRSAFVEQIIKSISALPFREEEARIHAELLSTLLSQGNLIGAHDLIIAATAITNNCAVLTKNEFDFNRIPGLEVLSVPALEKA